MPSTALTTARPRSGAIDSVTDDEIIAAYQRMARDEGIFCEPASAASVAGLIKTAATLDMRGQTCVCVITGAGLKDPDTARGFTSNNIEVPAHLAAIEAAIG